MNFTCLSGIGPIFLRHLGQSSNREINQLIDHSDVTVAFWLRSLSLFCKLGTYINIESFSACQTAE
jgi:hypothetical protein